MPSECLVISLILGVLVFGFFRAGRKNWAFAVLPLMVIPTVCGLTMYTVSDIMKKDFDIILPVALVIGSLAVTCIWIGMSSMILIKTKKLRIPYVAATVAFSVVLSIIIILKYQLLAVV